MMLMLVGVAQAEPPASNEFLDSNLAMVARDNSETLEQSETPPLPKRKRQDPARLGWGIGYEYRMRHRMEMTRPPRMERPERPEHPPHAEHPDRPERPDHAEHRH